MVAPRLIRPSDLPQQRLTTAQRLALVGGGSGLVFDTTLGKPAFWNDAAKIWVDALGSSFDLYTPAYDAAVAAYFDGRDLANGSVATWASRSRPNDALGQPSTGLQPTASSGVLTFNGTSQYLTEADLIGDNTAASAFVGAVQIPDASASAPGKGFTCTGLARAPDGTWWVGNHGVTDQTTAAGGSFTWAPSLVRLSSDFTTKLGEILLAPLYSGIQSVQGVAFDTSDNTLWFADVANGKVRHITQGGTPITADEITPSFVPNGVAYDPSADAIWVNDTNGGPTVLQISCATKAVLQTKVYPAIPLTDHLWFDATNKLLWMSYGNNNNPGIVACVNTAIDTIVATYRFTQADCIEGIWLDPSSNRLILVNDAYYHAGNPALNRSLTFSVPYPTAPFGASDVIEAWYCGKFAASPTATAAILSGNEPIAGIGWGIYGLSGGTSLRVFANTANGTTKQVQADFTGLPALTSDRIVYTRIDTTANLITVWVDGTQVGTANATLLDDNKLGLGNRHNVGAGYGATRPANFAMRALGFGIASAQRQKVEGFLAAAFGLQGNLPAGHPYKSSVPYF